MLPVLTMKENQKVLKRENCVETQSARNPSKREGITFFHLFQKLTIFIEIFECANVLVPKKITISSWSFVLTLN